MQNLMNVMTIVKQNFAYYSSGAFPMLLFFAALLFLLLGREKRNRNMGYVCLLFLILWLSPFFANNTMSFVLGSTPYYMLLSGLGAVSVTAYAMTLFADRFPWKQKLGMLAVLVLLLFAGVGFQVSGNGIDFHWNKLKISSEVQEIDEKLTEVDAIVIAPDEVASQLREYNLAATVLYRGGYSYNPDKKKAMLKVAEENLCNIIIFDKEHDDEAFMNRNDYERLMETEHYEVYIFLGNREE